MLSRANRRFRFAPVHGSTDGDSLLILAGNSLAFCCPCSPQRVSCLTSSFPAGAGRVHPDQHRHGHLARRVRRRRRPRQGRQEGRGAPKTRRPARPAAQAGTHLCPWITVTLDVCDVFDCLSFGAWLCVHARRGCICSQQPTCRSVDAFPSACLYVFLYLCLPANLLEHVGAYAQYCE